MGNHEVHNMQTNSLILLSAIGAASSFVQMMEGLLFGPRGFARRIPKHDDVFLASFEELNWRLSRRQCGQHLRNLAIRVWRGPRWQ